MLLKLSHKVVNINQGETLDCDGASFYRGVQSSFQYSVCLSASLGHIYMVDYFRCGYCASGN